MSFFDRPPSKQWVALKYRGETIAEVWFKPEGEPLALTFRISPSSFDLPGMAPLLTPENLLKSAGIAAEAVASWHDEGAAPSAGSESPSDLRDPLPPPAPDATHLRLFVRLKPPAEAAAAPESAAPEIPESKWQEIESRWKAILDLEATMDTLRISMEGLRAEMESASRRSLTTDEKVHALNADVAQWTKAKSRVLYSVPKVREFIHRSTWAAGTPERKKLEELYRDHIRPRIAFAEIDEVMVQLDNLLKDRQVLLAHGTSVFQECKSTAAEVQGALRNLQSNAAANATKKRGATAAKNKFF